MVMAKPVRESLSSVLEVLSRSTISLEYLSNDPIVYSISISSVDRSLIKENFSKLFGSMF